MVFNSEWLIEFLTYSIAYIYNTSPSQILTKDRKLSPVIDYNYS